jgi:hypothetical protein
MTLVLDAGALVAVERSDRDVVAVIKAEQVAGRPPVTHGGIVGQVWRSGGPRQAKLARLLRGVEVAPLDEGMGKQAGALLAVCTRDDVIDAAVILLAMDGDEILTSDPGDLHELAIAADLHVDVTPV